MDIELFLAALFHENKAFVVLFPSDPINAPFLW